MCDEPEEERRGGGGKEEKIRMVSRVLVEKKILAWNLMEDGKTHQELPYTFLLNYISLCKGCHLSWTFYGPRIQASPFPIPTEWSWMGLLFFLRSTWRMTFEALRLVSLRTFHIEHTQNTWIGCFSNILVLKECIPNQQHQCHLGTHQKCEFLGHSVPPAQKAGHHLCSHKPSGWFWRTCIGFWEPTLKWKASRVARLSSLFRAREVSDLQVRGVEGSRLPGEWGSSPANGRNQKNSIAQATPNTEHLEPCRVPGKPWWMRHDPSSPGLNNGDRGPTVCTHHTGKDGKSNRSKCWRNRKSHRRLVRMQTVQLFCRAVWWNLVKLKTCTFYSPAVPFLSVYCGPGEAPPVITGRNAQDRGAPGWFRQ